MDNKSQYNNEDIRPPDSVKKDTLIDNEFNRHINNFDSDYELDKVLELSKHEINMLEEKEEEELMKMFEIEVEERVKTFSDTIKLIKKMLVFDKANNTEIYNLLLSIIEMYQLGYINKYQLDSTSYYEIFHILKGLRMNSEDFILLQNIIDIK